MEDYQKMVVPEPSKEGNVMVTAKVPKSSGPGKEMRTMAPDNKNGYPITVPEVSSIITFFQIDMTGL